MSARPSRLWDLVWGKPAVDPSALASALDAEASRDGLDYRARLLVRDAADALEVHWGTERWRRWLASATARAAIEAIRGEAFEEVGYPFLREALMEPTRADDVRQLLRDLGARLNRPARVVIGGSCALILMGRLSRATQDVDLVDEIPAELRERHDLLDEIRRRYRLALTHFQSHFLPAGWEDRVKTLGDFGKLHASVVDEYDVFLSKLFSAREKDRDDLRALLPGLERETIVSRLGATCAGLMRDETLRGNAEGNWWVLTGERLG